MTALSALLLAISLALLPGAFCELVIRSISPTSGSLAGGTRLAIYGGGFPDMYSSMAIVYVGPYPCSVIMHLSSTEVLTCETSAGVAGTYYVAVAVTDEAPVNYYAFTYSDSYTPSFKTVYPYAGPPGTAMTIYGDATWNLQNVDCPAKSWGDIDCVGSITFGDYLCRQDPSAYGTGINFTYTSNQRYGTYLYILGCRLPTPDSNNPQTAIGTANNLNVSIRFEASMRGGKPRAMLYSYHYTVDGTPYQFQLYPEVTDVSPAVGSVAGGTLLTISGRGFPDLSLGLGDTVNVSIGGVPCTIVNSTYDTIFCVTGPKPDRLPSPVGGLYPGMRGIEYEYYNMSVQVPSFSGLWTLNKTVTLGNTNGTGSYKTVLTGAMESIHYETTFHCDLLKTFFIAPRTGNYSFYLQADDFAQLNGTWQRAGGVVQTSTLVEVKSYTYIDNYFRYPFQKSAAVTFTAGQAVLLQSGHCNGPSVGMQQVAVRMEVPAPQPNSIAEQQTITASAVLVPRSLAIKYLYGAGANTTAFTINVTSRNDTMLSSASLGLELTLSASAWAADKAVVLPLLATAREMTVLIEAAFGGIGSLGSNGTSFGVYKARIPGLLTVQVGLDSGLAASLGFNIELAQLVVVPNGAPFLAASCAGNGTIYSPPPSFAADAANATAGMVVLLEQARPVPAVPPGGYFQLRLASRSDAVVLPYDTNATIMYSAVRNLTGLDTWVTFVPVRREGVFLARVWNVTFSIWAFNSVTDIVAETNDRSPAGVDMSLELRVANPPVTGSFRVGFGSSCGSVEIGVTDAAETIRLKLASLPGMTAPQSVGVSGGPTYGYTYTVTFDPVGNPGDQPPLRVVDISGLNGIGANASVATIMDGSTDAFYAPIPTEFLRLAVAQPGTINLLANGVPSACADASGICGFQYSEAVTPHITSVSPSVLQFISQSSLPLTITGSQFLDGPSVEVRVGTALCNVTSVTDTKIVCDVPDTAPAGIRLVTVNVAGRGLALGATNVTLETLYVTGSAPSPPVLASVGLSVLNFTGKGFDYVNCANNELLIDTAACGILACGPHFLTVLYRGSGGADVPAAAVTAQVFENTTQIDSDTPAGITVQISGSAPAISSISPANMPGCGGTITVALSGATASQVASVFMVQAIPNLLNYTQASAAYRGRLPCTDIAPASAGAAVTCTSPALRNGAYHTLVILSSGLQLLSTNTILFELIITRVYPNLGSIGGNTTVTITGSGFSPNLAANAVFMTVPVSTTFLNGIVECVPVNVTTTTLTCRTGNSMAANADADDPKAHNVMPVASAPRAVSVVLCDPTFTTTVLRGYCWSLDETPRANCLATDPSDCAFGYATDLTPVIGYPAPHDGYGGLEVTVYGAYTEDITTVKFIKDGVVMGYGLNVRTVYTGVACDVPDLRPGVYTTVLMKGNGELSVDPYGKGVYTVRARLMTLENNVGSLAGGLPLGLTVGGAGLAVNNSDNVVTIAGVPCPLLSVESRTHLTCRAPAFNGYVYAEYWNMGWSTYSMPDLITWTDPLITRLEKGMAFAWNGSSPAVGIIQLDYFAARFTFYYQLSQQENVTFVIDSDDDSRLYVNDELLGNRGTYLSTVLPTGVHKIVVTYVEYTGWASVKLRVALTPPNGTMGALAYLEWQKVTPMAPGTVLPVELTVSGVDSFYTCPETITTLQLPYGPPLTFEPSQVTIKNCGYVYTMHRTPTLTSMYPMTTSGIIAPNFNGLAAIMTAYGNFLIDPSLPAADQISISLANQSCNITNVAQATYNSISATNITCAAPYAPVGTWGVSIMVKGLGLTRPTATAATDLPLVTYGIKVLSYNSPTINSAVTRCQFSLFGGGTFNFSGYGLVKGLVDTNYGLNMTAAWDTTSSICGAGTSNSLPCQAANTSRMNLVALGCDGPTAAFQLTRFKVPNPEAFAGNNSIQSVTVRFRPRVYNISSNNKVYSQPGVLETLYFCGGRTPALSGVTPSSPSPDAGATLSLTWYLASVGSQNDTIIATTPGKPSNATVEFEVGPTVLRCANPVVTAASISAMTYNETISCQMPGYLPAGTYTLWVCIQPFGCGQVPAYQVPLTVITPSSSTGSSAGGVSVVITGKGFDLNSTFVSARFGNSTCKITSSSATSVTCLTGPLDTKPATAVTWPLSITPTIGAAEVTYPGFTFTFDPALEASMYNITPARGSTEGGTPVTIIGAGFQVGVTTTVTIGDTPCTSVRVINSTAITCTTGKPPSNILRVPLPVTVLQNGRGYPRGLVQYQYFDVWSRNSTWNGGPLPGYGDTVVIPAGYTILLDISPPKLYIIVIEGELIFDDTKEYINLQAHYIIVHGGNFTIGSAEKPYPGRANITMHGAPNSKDLPQYGAKSLAVRTGIVTFYGQPKLPHYTKLNRTADPGDTSIVVNGPINWKVGDHIVIATSSYLPWENDEAIIMAIDNSTVPGCAVLTLDTPLKYTHVGEIHSVNGTAPLDMRAEVAVLTRNIVLQGDYTSAKNQYGVQIMVNTPSYLPKGLVRFDNIEITQSGQAFRLGRYSMHWHLMGDLNWQSWVRGCTIHHTYNRAITVHGTHRAIIQNVTAYHTMGHTFFLEDGIESMNLIENTISIYAKVSDALLNTDTTPGAFWMTNPNNTLRNCVAVGSMAHGIWYRLLDYPDGPSATTSVCVKFTPLLEYTNITAHSNMFYGLRIHPEFYPRNNPCSGFYGAFQQVPAVFNGMVAYKNGMKGAVASQMALVQFTNMVMGDNGGGPKQLSVSAKDHGASMEMTWVTDDRNRYDVSLTQMAGFVNSTIYARTTAGNRGTAGRWYSDRRVTGIISQSSVKNDDKHSALMSMINMTFVDFTADKVGFSALEHCGKCKTYQGGATTFTANISFINSDGTKPVLSVWSWGHQGIFLDTDGTLLNKQNLPAEFWPDPAANWTFGPGATWQSAVENDLFDPAECVYIRNSYVSNNGAYCSPALTFRRVLLNGHGPESLKYKPLDVVSLATNRTSVVHFSGYNEEGYMFTNAVNRDYWLTWDMVWYRLDPEYYRIHKMDVLNSSDYVFYSTKYMQVKDHFTVNSVKNNRTELPPALPNTTHGDFFYNKTEVQNSWVWSYNHTYNDTKFTVYVGGHTDAALNVNSYPCPDEGCNNLPPVVVDVRNGTLYWSNASTWNVSIMSYLNYSKPTAGANVTIPQGWDLVIDESPPQLLALTIQGNVRFDPTRDVNLTAVYIIVMGEGVLSAGSADAPHPKKATIFLEGTRDTPDYAIDNDLNLGSKVLVALSGGTINLYGLRVNKRWIRLGSRAAPGDSKIRVSDPSHGWQIGDRILITSTSFNWNQTEIRTITGILNGGSDLVLDSPLNNVHSATYKAYPGGPTVDLRAEVGLASSNVLITSHDGEYQHTLGIGELLGAHVTISGASTGRFDSISMEYCGQAGLSNHSCIFFDRLQSVQRTITDNSTNTTTTVTVDNPSFLYNSSLMWGLATNVRIGADLNATVPTKIIDNVMFEAFEANSVAVLTNGNIIRGNLVLGTIKDMAQQSTFDTVMPASFYILSAANWVTDNVAAGGERYGFTYHGVPCSTANFTTGAFRNNSAHSYLAGMWLRASNESSIDGCTALRNFTVYLNWDFGIITTQGIATDIVLENVNVLDNKHAGLHLMRLGALTEPASMWWYGGLLAGQSSEDVCTACAVATDPGCHPKLSMQSFNQYSPHTPAIGLDASQFALLFYAGPESKPWDKAKSYAMVHGMFNITGITIADFKGPTGCGGVRTGTYALANHHNAPETFYPHYFSNINVVDVTSGPDQGMFLNIDATQSWRGELCGEANYTREDGSVIMLTCAGPKHVHWRDLDGSLTGTIGVTAGNFKSGPRVFPMDQGSPVLPGACTYSSIVDSYQCAQGSTEFLLDARLKPKPVPADGIWGDAQMFVLESRDKDSEDRNFGPVFFNVSGSIDLVTAHMDHGCCFTYKCQKRLSMFATYLPTGQTTYINFTGTPAQIFRMWLPYADPDKEIVLVINYLYTLNRRFVMLPAGVSDVVGRITPEPEPPVIGDGKGHGAYYWDQNNTLMYVKLKGGKHLEVRTESAVQISQKFALTVDQFWDISELFLKSLAYAMNISMDRVFIVKVVAGSSVVTTAIASAPVQVDELTIAEGRDAGDPVPTEIPVIDPPAELTADDVACLQSMGDSAPKVPTVSDMLVLRQLCKLFQTYLTTVDKAAADVGTTTLGVPMATFPAISAAAEAVQYETVKAAAEAAANSSPPPPSPAPSSAQGEIIPVGNSGTDSGSGSSSGNGNTDSGGGGSTGGGSSGGSSSSDKKKSFPVGAVVGGAVGGALIAGVVMLAIFAVQRRKAKHLRPVTPPGELEQPEGAPAAASVPESPIRRSPDSQGGNGGPREAFMGVASIAPASPAGSIPASRRSSAVAERDAERALLASPRRSVPGATVSCSLAAGYVAPSEPEVIRPLVSTNKQPHTAVPLVMPTFPLGSPTVSGKVFQAVDGADAGTPSRRQSTSAVPKAPAELQRADSSLNRNSAPQWEGVEISPLPPTAMHGRMSRSVTESRPTSGAGGSRPGSGRPGSVHPDSVRPGSGGSRPAFVEAAPRAGAEVEVPAKPLASADEPATALGAAAAGGETVVVPVQRSLETMESFVPRPKSRATGSRPGSGSTVHVAGADGLGQDADKGVEGATDLMPGAPPHQEIRRRSSQTPPQATMMLPGGMMAFEASPSLIRSEVAALMIAAAGSNQGGFGGTAEAAMQEEQQGTGGGSPQAARTPAGLRSDSMRVRDSDERAQEW